MHAARKETGDSASNVPRVPEQAPWSVVRYLDLSYIKVRVEGTTMHIAAKRLAPRLGLPGREVGVIDRVTLHGG